MNLRHLALSIHSYAVEYVGMAYGQYGPAEGQHKWSN
jgi:hypothetical protein